VRKGAGKAGRRLAPAVPCANKTRTGWTTGDAGTTGLPCADGFTAYVALSPGSDALLPPSPCGWLMRGPGWAAAITATLDAQTPGVRTTRFCRRAHRRPCLRWLACARHRDRTRTLSAPCRIARAAAHGDSALQLAQRADAVAATASRPASRDDRETPLAAGGMRETYGISEFL
jgi:hypothetical protein